MASGPVGALDHLPRALSPRRESRGRDRRHPHPSLWPQLLSPRCRLHSIFFICRLLGLWGVVFYSLTFFRVFGSGLFLLGMLMICLFLGRVGDVFVWRSCPAAPAPRSVSGLVWIIGSLHCGTGQASGVLVWSGFGRVLAYPGLVSFSPCRSPPPLGSWGRSG